MTRYFILLSMGHDTDLKWSGWVSAKCRTDALSFAYDAAREYWGGGAMTACYRKKGVIYLPYYFIEHEN